MADMLCLLCVLLLGLSAVGAQPVAAQQQLASKVAALQSYSIMFLECTQSLNTVYGQIQDTVQAADFPRQLFSADFSKSVRTPVVLSSKILASAQGFLRELASQNRTAQLLDDLTQSKWLFAQIELDELRTSVRDVIQPDIETLGASVYKLEDLLCVPLQEKPLAYWADMATHRYGLPAVCAILWCILIKRSTALHSDLKLWVLLFGIALLGALCARYYPFDAMRMALGGSSAQVQKLRNELNPYGVNLFQGLTGAIAGVTENLEWLEEYAGSMEFFNDTVISAMQRFSQRVSTASSSSELAHSHPEVAMQLVIDTRARIQAHKSSLERLALAQSKRNGSANKDTSLEKLLGFMQAFEMFFSQMEISIYANLRTGLDLNQFFAENLDILYQHIRDGKLTQGLHILNELYRQQSTQLEKLTQANRFVSAANDAVAQVRLESARLQLPLESEEFDSWLRKMAYQTMSSTAFAASLSPMLLPGLANPLLAIPTTTACLVVAVMGYNQGKHNGELSLETRSIMNELQTLDSVMEQTERELTAHESMLSVLMQEVSMLMLSVNKSQARFGYIKVQRQLSDRELQMLDAGVTRVKESVQVLSKRYSIATEVLFGRIIQAAQARQQQQQQQLPASIITEDTTAAAES